MYTAMSSATFQYIHAVFFCFHFHMYRFEGRWYILVGNSGMCRQASGWKAQENRRESAATISIQMKVR